MALKIENNRVEFYNDIMDDIKITLGMIERDKMITEYKCNHCGRSNYYPIVARKEDIEKLNELMNILGDFYEKHPIIAKLMMEDLLQSLKEFYEKNSGCEF